MSLNPNQELAVKTTQGRVLVLAGAGSGKTRVITHRIAYLIQECGVAPEAILALTFTNKAAAEMRHRVEALIDRKLASKVTLSTFHSFCMQLLRKEIQTLGYTTEFSLYDEQDMQRLIKQVARNVLGHEGELPPLGSALQAINAATQEGGTKKLQDPFTKELYQRIHSTLRAHNAVSFDHLITLALDLFQNHPAVLNRYQEQYRYLMIDEYQDTNQSQSHLAELLASKYQNLCVVGDDDQSIYGWRGASVKNILEFRADQTIKLEQNFRSTCPILAAANGLIQHNQQRHKKALWSLEKSSDLIQVFHAPTEAEEAQAVIERILHYKETKNLRFKDMAILYRSNALSRPFELALLQASWQKEGRWVRGIPYEIFGGLEFSERSEIKDLISYLRLIANPLDQEALLRIINVPRRGISDLLLDELTKENRFSNLPLWNILQQIAQGRRPLQGHPKGMKGIASFVDLIEKASHRFSSDSLAEAMRWFLEEIHYEKAIEEEVKSESMRSFKWENVEGFVQTLAQYEEETGKEASIQHFASHTTLGKKPFATQTSSTDKVQLMTLHSAKGLEFPAVFIVGLEDQILPHEKGMQETGVEEERRLFYVGITRAQKHLTLSMARSRPKMGKIIVTTPSRFLFELPKEVLKMTSHKFFE